MQDQVVVVAVVVVREGDDESVDRWQAAALDDHSGERSENRRTESGVSCEHDIRRAEEDHERLGAVGFASKVPEIPSVAGLLRDDYYVVGGHDGERQSFNLSPVEPGGRRIVDASREVDVDQPVGAAADKARPVEIRSVPGDRDQMAAVSSQRAADRDRFPGRSGAERSVVANDESVLAQFRDKIREDRVSRAPVVD